MFALLIDKASEITVLTQLALFFLPSGQNRRKSSL